MLGKKKMCVLREESAEPKHSKGLVFLTCPIEALYQLKSAVLQS